jgi:hypothetical protein
MRTHVLLGVVASENGLLFSHDDVARLDDDVGDEQWRDQRRHRHPDLTRHEVRIGGKPDRAWIYVGIHQGGATNHVGAKRIGAALHGDESYCGAAVIAFAYREERRKGVHAVEAISRTLRYEFTPFVAADGSGQESKIRRPFVGDFEPPVLARGVNEVFDTIFNAGTASFEHGQRCGWIRGNDVVDFGRHCRVGNYHDDGVVATTTDRYCELRVVLLKIQRVITWIGANFMTPYLPRSHGVVNARIKEVSTVVRPREAVIDVVELIGDGVLSEEWSDRQVVKFVAVEVRAHRDPSVVGTDREDPHGEKRVIARL